jgi:hypothetical protein
MSAFSGQNFDKMEKIEADIEKAQNAMKYIMAIITNNLCV